MSTLASRFGPGLADALFQHSSAPVLILDRDYAIVAANPAAARLLALPAETLVGRSFVALLDEYSHTKALGALASASATPQTIELNMQSEAGIQTWRWEVVALDQALLLMGASLEPMVAATQELLSANRRLARLLELSSYAAHAVRIEDVLDPILRHTVQILDSCAGMIFLAGRAGEPLHLVAHCGWKARWVAAHRSLIGPILGWSPLELAAGVVLQGAGFAADLRISEADFTQNPDPWLETIALPFDDPEGYRGWLMIVADRFHAFDPQDIELLKGIAVVLGQAVAKNRAIYQLSERSAQLLAVLETIKSGVLLADLTDTIIYANSGLGTLIGADDLDLVGLVRSSSPLTALALLPADPLFEGDLLAVPGVERRILQRITETVRGDDALPLGLIEVYRDVTQVITVQEIKDEFIAAAAHDLKTPVTAIKGYAQIALRFASRLDSPQLLRQLEIINARTTELTYLMDSMLDMSRIQSNRFQLELSEFDAREAVEAAVAHFGLDLSRRKHELAVALPEAPVPVCWDRARVERLLVNLLSNALKYSPEGGPVTVTLQVLDAAQVTLVVSDSGIGIPAAERDRIWERFYRVREAIDFGFKGTGIGLYIAKSIVHEHGGTISALDTLHGGPGTTIRIELPVTAPEPGAALKG